MRPGPDDPNTLQLMGDLWSARNRRSVLRNSAESRKGVVIQARDNPHRKVLRSSLHCCAACLDRIVFAEHGQDWHASGAQRIFSHGDMQHASGQRCQGRRIVAVHHRIGTPQESNSCACSAGDIVLFPWDVVTNLAERVLSLEVAVSSRSSAAVGGSLRRIDPKHRILWI